MNGLWKRFIDALYPMDLVCIFCGEERLLNKDGVCKKCESTLLHCAAMPALPGTDGFAAGLVYTEHAERAVHDLKYNGISCLAPRFAAYMRVPDNWRIDVIAPVPLHERKLALRGYNQSALIAQSLGERLCLPVEEGILTRVRDTASQARLPAAEREKNVRGAFALSGECEGRRVLLIDDVRTTGATLRECARVLRKAKAASVYAMTAFAAERL